MGHRKLLTTSSGMCHNLNRLNSKMFFSFYFMVTMMSRMLSIHKHSYDSLGLNVPKTYKCQ